MISSSNPLSTESTASRIILTLAIALTAAFAWLSFRQDYAPVGGIGELLNLLKDKSLYGNALADLGQMRGAYIRDIWGVLVFISMASLIFACGSFCTKRFASDLAGECTALLIPLNWALGSGIVAMLWFFLATFGLIYSAVAYLLCTAGLLITFFRVPAIFKDLKSRVQDTSDWPILERIVFYFIAVWILLWGLNAFVPETWLDSLVYQLGLPSFYIANGEFKPDPHVIFSYNFQNAQMLYLWALLAKSEVALKLLNWTFLLMLTLTVYGLVRQLSNRFCGFAAALLVCIMPMTVWQVTYASNDLQTAFYLLVGWMLLANFMKQGSKTQQKKQPDGSRIQVLILSGFCFGIAIGTKISALAVAFWSFLALLYFLHRDYGRRLMFSLVCGWTLGLFLFSSPWFARNLWYAGNPLYPFFQGITGQSHVKEWHDAKILVGTTKEFASNKSLAVISGFRELIEVLAGLRYGETLMYQTGWILGIFLLALILFFSRGDPALYARLSAAVGIASFWAMSYVVVNPRYALVCMFFLAIPAGIGMITLSENRIFRVVLITLILSNLLFHGTLQILRTYVLQSGVMTLIGASLERFKFTVHPFTLINVNDFAEINDFAQSFLDDEDKVLMAGFYTPYRFKMRFHYSSNLDRQLIDELLELSETPEDLGRNLKERGFTHILFDGNGWDRYMKTQYSNMTAEKTKVFEDYLSGVAKPFARTRTITFYRLE